MLDRRDAWHTSPVTRDRLLEVNRQALEFYRAQYTPQCWSRAYLTERLGVDIADDPRFQPGHAPDSWTALTAPPPPARRHATRRWNSPDSSPGPGTGGSSTGSGTGSSCPSSTTPRFSGSSPAATPTTATTTRTPGRST